MSRFINLINIMLSAFSVVLQECGMSQGNLGQGGGSGYMESTDNSSSEVEECNISDGDDVSFLSNCSEDF